jgi:hypothetical protein
MIGMSMPIKRDAYPYRRPYGAKFSQQFLSFHLRIEENREPHEESVPGFLRFLSAATGTDS